MVPNREVLRLMRVWNDTSHMGLFGTRGLPFVKWGVWCCIGISVLAPPDSVVLPGQQRNNNPWTSAFRQDHISSVHQFQGMFDVLRESRKFQVACLQFTSVIVNTHCVPYHSFFLFGGGGGDSYLKYQQVPTVKFIFVMKHSISFQLFISRIRLIHIFFLKASSWACHFDWL